MFSILAKNRRRWLKYLQSSILVHCDPPILAQPDVQDCRVVNDVLNHVSESLTSDILPGPSDVVENLK